MSSATSTSRTETNIERATIALEQLQQATTDAERLAAAQMLESAACQLRRALKKAVGS